MAAQSTMKRPAMAIPRKSPRKGSPAKGAGPKSPAKGAEPKSIAKDAAPKSPAKGTAPKGEPVSPAPSKATAAKASAQKHPPIPKDAAKRMHSKLQTLAKSGRDGLQKAYKQCKTQEEKRSFFYDKYLLDPEVSEKIVLKKDQQENVVTEDNIDDWFTAEQVAKFKGIEPGVDQYKELVAASVKGLPDRKHEDENLAALGVMQYHYQATKTKSQTLKRKSLELQEQVGRVSQEDFADMRAAMNPKSVQIMIGSSASKQSKGDSGPSLHKADADGDVDLEVNWAQVYKDNQKKCKSSLGSMATELHNCDTLLGKIAALSDKSEMKPLLSKQVLAQKVLMEEEKNKFLKEHLAFPKACSDEAQAEDKNEALTDLVNRMASFLKGWKKELSAHKNFLDQEG